MEKKHLIDLKNLPLPPQDPLYYPVRKIKTNCRYVPKNGKPRQEDGSRSAKFDSVANTEADLLAGINISQIQTTCEEERDASNCSVKHVIESNNGNTANSYNLNKLNFERETCFDKQSGLCSSEAYCTKDSGSNRQPRTRIKEERSKVSAKSQLHEICAANNWKSPVFEICKEEGPCHLRLFTIKVRVEIKGATTGMVLECFGGARPQKKAAADHAAEGALWYLRHLGYFPKAKSKKTN